MLTTNKQTKKKAKNAKQKIFKWKANEKKKTPEIPAMKLLYDN